MHGHFRRSGSHLHCDLSFFSTSLPSWLARNVTRKLSLISLEPLVSVRHQKQFVSTWQKFFILLQKNQTKEAIVTEGRTHPSQKNSRRLQTAPNVDIFNVPSPCADVVSAHALRLLLPTPSRNHRLASCASRCLFSRVQYKLGTPDRLYWLVGN